MYIKVSISLQPYPATPLNLLLNTMHRRSNSFPEKKQMDPLILKKSLAWWDITILTEDLAPTLKKTNKNIKIVTYTLYLLITKNKFMQKH